jgi:hypothetical protein
MAPGGQIEAIIRKTVFTCVLHIGKIFLKKPKEPLGQKSSNF